jgi:hypothetical protein
LFRTSNRALVDAEQFGGVTTEDRDLVVVAESRGRQDVIDRALKRGPQAITRNGRPAVVAA